MSSIMTNTSAMAALATLRSINSDMSMTQNRISTGYKVDGASDNAAYWSIATTMRSDSKSLSTVQESLGLGKASVDIAYEAMDSAIEIVQEIQKKLVSAKADNVDKSKIQGEITELQGQLSSIVNSASFNSENYLSADKSDTAALLKSIVGSFNRDANGNVSIENLKIDTTDFVMVDNNAAAVDAEFNSGTVMITDAAATAETDAWTLTFDGTTLNFVGSQTAEEIAAAMADAEFENFVIEDRGGGDIAYVDKRSGVQTEPVAADFALGGAALATDATFAETAVTTATDTLNTTGLLNQQFIVGIDDTTDEAITATLLSFDITNIGGEEATKTEIDNLIDMVDGIQKQMVDGASTLGAVQTRIDIQTDFLANLMDSIDSGIGTLVDADMNEESTRLKALQTQQQLGIQALSIANSNSENILQLFR